MSPDVLTPPVAAPAAPTATPASPTAAATPGMSEAQRDAWRRRITAALEATKPAIEQGKQNVARYTGKGLEAMPAADECVVPTDFYYIEAKKAQLFYRLPEVFLKPGKPGLDDAAVVFQAALNKEIGPEGVNVLPTVQQVIFDLLCPTGYGAMVVGYQTAIGDPPTVPVQVGEEPDPDAAVPPMMPGAVLGLQAPPMRPVFAPAPNIVASWYFAEHIKPGDLLIDPALSGWTSTRPRGSAIGSRKTSRKARRTAATAPRTTVG
jgi:hypothetical protein